MSRPAIFLLLLIAVVAAIGLVWLTPGWVERKEDQKEEVARAQKHAARPDELASVPRPIGEDTAEAPDVGPEFPDFNLTDGAGQLVTRAHLMGRAWLVAVQNDPPSHLADDTVQLRFRELESELTNKPFATDVALVRLVRSRREPQDEASRIGSSPNSRGEGVEQHELAGGAVDGLAAFVDVACRDSGYDAGGRVTLSLVDPQGNWRRAYDAARPESIWYMMGDIERVLSERVLIVENRVGPPFVVRSLIDPPWVESRRAAQIDARAALDVRHDFRFEDRRPESGIAFRHRIVDDAGRSLVTAHYDHGTGVAIADVDGDGLSDLYFVNQVGTSRLYRNAGGGKFEDITEQAGLVMADRIGVAASFADTDNDGDADLFVTSVRGGNTFFANDGKGRFTDATREAGLTYSGHSSSAEFFDYDRDGRLDLFLVNVGVYTRDVKATVVNDPYTGPDRGTYEYYVSNADAFAAHLKPERSERSVLYHNVGDNRFEDVTEAMGIVDTNWTGDATPIDANEDGWIDLYLVNMQGHDEYYENNGGRRFERRGRDRFPATPWGSMGVKSFDFDNDGQSGYLSQSSAPLYFGLDTATEVDAVEVIWPSGTSQTVPPPLAVNGTLEIREP